MSQQEHKQAISDAERENSENPGMSRDLRSPQRSRWNHPQTLTRRTADLHVQGSAGLPREDGNYIEGNTYKVGDAEYLVHQAGERVELFDLYSENPLTPLPEERTQLLLPVIQQQMHEDQEVMEARASAARELAEGDSKLEQILTRHLEYNQGHISEPKVVDGISFWIVGRNASHEFFAGVKDGTLYRTALGEELDPKYKDFTSEQLFKHFIKKVGDKEGWGYMGHY